MTCGPGLLRNSGPTEVLIALCWAPQLRWDSLDVSCILDRAFMPVHSPVPEVSGLQTKMKGCAQDLTRQ